MWFDGAGPWWPLFILMPLLMLIGLGFMVWMMGGMFGFGRRGGRRRDTESPERMLAERFAAGDIDAEEYQTRIAALSGRRK